MYSEARNVLSELVQVNPQDFHQILKLSEIEHTEGKPARALEYIEDCLRLDPLNPDALLMKGRVLLTQEKYKQAGRTFREMIEVQERRPVAHYLLGQALERAGDFHEALAAYRKAHELAPHQERYLTVYEELKVKMSIH